jgi:hypothetical protein
MRIALSCSTSSIPKTNEHKNQIVRQRPINRRLARQYARRLFLSKTGTASDTKFNVTNQGIKNQFYERFILALMAKPSVL